jgi:ribulose-bisphosphate carboxylase large chain
MNEQTSSCQVGAPVGSVVSGSRILRFQLDFRWQGVPMTEYKAPGPHWCGIKRASLVGETGEQTQFHVRYFEIAPGGFSSLEHHAHEHVVVVLRGRGEVQLGRDQHALRYGDTIYVAPHEVHQFRNPSSEEPFGFLCIVDARRDAPVVHEELTQ